MLASFVAGRARLDERDVLVHTGFIGCNEEAVRSKTYSYLAVTNDANRRVEQWVNCLWRVPLWGCC